MVIWLTIAVLLVVAVSAYWFWHESDAEEVDGEEERHVMAGNGEKYSERFELDPNQNPNELYGGDGE